MNREYVNTMKLEFRSISSNEGLARSAAAAFLIPMDPTTEELTEIKTSISEAVSNAIIHGYECNGEGIVTMICTIDDCRKLVIRISDKGAGIRDIAKAREPLFTTGDTEERSGMGFTVMESFMDRLDVESEEGVGTTVIMSKTLDSTGVSQQEL